MTANPTLLKKMGQAIRAEVERQGRLVGYVSSDEELARAARDVMVEEMREPSEQMLVEAGGSWTNSATKWRAMLAAFKKEQADG